MKNLTPFINIQTDYGFKKIFGTSENKHILIRFLNALFEDSLIVNDVVYHDKEMLPPSEDGKRIIYDIYCTANDGSHHIILEMQNWYQYPFEDRVLFYTARMIAEQGQRGWNYILKPVISVVLTNFDFSPMKSAMIHDMVFADRNSGEILSDKMRIIFLSLRFMEEKTWDNCHNEIERLLYLIKNMDKMDKDSEIYKSGNYEDIFKASETELMANEEVVAYSQSLQKLHDIQSGMDYLREKSYTEGHEEGRRQERRKSILLMVSMGIPVETISRNYGVSAEEIKRILES